MSDKHGGAAGAKADAGAPKEKPDENAKPEEKKASKGKLARFFSGAGNFIESAARIVDVVLDLEVIKIAGTHFAKPVGEAVGKGAAFQMKKMRKGGNFREFNEAMSLLTDEGFEFIDELMDLMTNEQQERFQQQMALTGETAEHTAAILRKLTGRGTHAQTLAYLKKTDYLQKPASEKGNVVERVVGDMSTVRAEGRAFLDEIKNDIAGLNPPQGGAQ